jgi:mRNA interferase MazF
MLVIQNDPLNEAGHPSSWILPCTTRVGGENVLRAPLPHGMAGLRQQSEVMIDQSRSIDNRRFLRPVGRLPRPLLREVEEKLRRLGDL